MLTTTTILSTTITTRIPTTTTTTTMATILMAPSIRCLFLYAEGLGLSIIKDSLQVRKCRKIVEPKQYNIESALHVKLYVAQVSRIATEELIRPLFEQFGSVIEVVILRDKRTGHQQGTCFVKFATQHEADRAITALNNQHYFPGEAFPMTVKYADGELERLETLGKVYVNGLNKEASWKEVEDIFSPYGLVLDVYILRDELRQSRGCGFVKFSQIDMALAAIKALNGTFIMRGCAQPLLVRFADPKKPKGIDSRGNFGFSSGNIGPHSQEPFRLVSDHGDPMGGHNFHSAPYPVQQTSNPPIPQLTNPEPLASIVMPPPQLCRMPLQQTQNTQRSSQTSQVEANETQKQHLTQPSGQIIGQQQSSQTVASNSTSPALASSHETAVPLECDWSEHTCPDGYKYYYNCETCESIWDKPEEFALFEKQLQTQTQTQPQNSSHHLQSTSVLSIQQSDQAQVEIQTHAFHQTLQLQKPSLSSTELDHLQIQPQTSPLVGPT
ncbi:hypothetical protein PS2_046819 [Malus domestica]